MFELCDVEAHQTASQRAPQGPGSGSFLGQPIAARGEQCLQAHELVRAPRSRGQSREPTLA